MSRRPGWDLKGKVSDMEAKVQNYQSRVKSVNQENDTLKDSINKVQKREAEIKDENNSLKKRLRLVNEKSKPSITQPGVFV